jgi:hypothetical protein
MNERAVLLKKIVKSSQCSWPMARGNIWTGGPVGSPASLTPTRPAVSSRPFPCHAPVLNYYTTLAHRAHPSPRPRPRPPQMGHARRRGHRHAHHRHRCPRRSALPATAFSLLFLTVLLLSDSLLSAPPLEDRHGITSSRRSLRLPTVWPYFSYSAPWRVRAARSHRVLSPPMF